MRNCPNCCSTIGKGIFIRSLRFLPVKVPTFKKICSMIDSITISETPHSSRVFGSKGQNASVLRTAGRTGLSKDIVSRMFKNELMGTSVLGVIDGTTVTIEMIIVANRLRLGLIIGYERNSLHEQTLCAVYSGKYRIGTPVHSL